MSLKIKLKRTGRKKRFSFKIVVSETRSKRNGKNLEEIGYFNPFSNPPVLNINKQSLEKWIRNGAKLTDGVKKIIASIKEK